VEMYVSAAQRALARGDHAESEKQADKALKIDPASAPALTVKARSASSQGKFAEAAQFLKGLSGLDKGGEQSEFLLDLYLKSSNWDDASSLALQVFEGDEKNFGLAQKVAEAMLESGQTEQAMTLVSRLRIPMLDAGEHDAITRMLNDLASKTPGRLEPLEWLVDSYGRTSDSFRLPDALAHLGDALAEAGQLDRAKEIFEQLVDRQPESDFAKRKLNHILRRMGMNAPEEEFESITETLQAEIPQPEAPKLRPDLDIPEEEKVASANVVHEQPDEETQKFISQSLTDVDLFASYGLTQKAIGLLEAILRRAPHHTPTLEKLLDFVLGAGDDRRTAELAAQLERIHQDRGEVAGAERFGELRRRFQRAAGLSDEDMAAAAAPVAAPAADEQATVLDQSALEELPGVPAQAETPAAPPSSAPEIQEVDLSDEWASLLANDTTPAETAAVPPPPPPVPPAKAAAPEESAISEFEIPVEDSSEATIELIEPAEETAREAQRVAPPPPPPPAPPPAPQVAPPAPPEPVAQPGAEIDLAEEYELVLSPEPAPEAAEPAKPSAANGALASDQFLSDLADEIDKLGIGELTPSYSEPAPKEEIRAAAPARAEAPLAPAENAPLKEVFDDFRADLGEMGGEDEDLETHYNLGIAFREMGLLEEAISEFQKVAKANERGKAFRYAMQCCTLLGLAFMEKGQPSIAAIWYERALRTPGVDAESSLALRYDLGVAQESANDLDAALKSFSHVYAVNIDYRDVADRIAALQKTTR